jgi:hypothetical protein
LLHEKCKICGLRQQIGHELSVHIGQPEVATLIAEGEPLVIDAEEMEDRGVEVVHVHGILDYAEAKIVGPTKGEAAFHAAAGERRSAFPP